MVCNATDSVRLMAAAVSQSPYGAKRFATSEIQELERAWAVLAVAIPLRGYVVCNSKAFARVNGVAIKSQSPYRAKWFATLCVTSARKASLMLCRNPLTGLSGLQPWGAL